MKIDFNYQKEAAIENYKDRKINTGIKYVEIYSTTK